MTDYAKKLKEYSEWNQSALMGVGARLYEWGEKEEPSFLLYNSFQSHLARVHEHRQFDFMRKLIAESFAEELETRIFSNENLVVHDDIIEAITKLKAEYCE